MKKINNLYTTFQKFGGSLVSFNELKNRFDFILFLVGSNDISSFHEFVGKRKWNKDKVKSIFFLEKQKKNSFNILVSQTENIFHDINLYMKIERKKK